MADFSTSSLLEIEVSQRSLRDAKRTVENEIGSVGVDVNASGLSGQLQRDMRARSDGGVSATGAGSLGVQKEMLNQLEDINDHLEQISLGGGGGGGGGGGFGNILTGYLLRGRVGKAAGAGGGILSGLLGSGSLMTAGALSLPFLSAAMMTHASQRRVPGDNTATGENIRGPFQNIASMQDPANLPAQFAEDLSAFRLQQPEWMQDAMSLQVDAPPWLQSLLGGGGGGVTQRNASIGGGGQQRFTPDSGGFAPRPPTVGGGNRASQRRNQSLSGDFTLDITIPDVSREIEQAIQNSNLQREVEQAIEDLIGNQAGGFF